MGYRYAWFRVYHEILYDPKLRALPSWARWLWIVTLALASSSKQRGTITGVEAMPKAIYDAAGFQSTGDDARTLEDVRWAFRQYARYGMVARAKDGWRLVHWDARQYDYPSSRPEQVGQRVRQWRRQRGRNEVVTSAKRPRNEVETSAKRPRNEGVTSTKRQRNDTEERRLDREYINPPSLSPPLSSIRGTGLEHIRQSIGPMATRMGIESFAEDPR